MPRLKLEYAVAAGLAVVVAMVVMNLVNSDVRWCQRVFAGLVKGNPSVRSAIAWDRFRAEDVDVGATYARLPNAQEQLGYQQGFIQSFSKGFQEEGGRLRSFTNWRAETDGSVAVDYPAKQKTLLFHLSAEAGRRQLVGIGWQQP